LLQYCVINVLYNKLDVLRNKNLICRNAHREVLDKSIATISYINTSISLKVIDREAINDFQYQ